MNPPLPTQTATDDAAIAAARARLAADRRIRHLDRVLLTAEEERGLALMVRAGGDALPSGHFAYLTGERRGAAEALLLHNTRLVAHIARSHLWTGLEFDDLTGHGVLGLIRAVELFDPRVGTRFSTYATWWIRQRIWRAAATESRLIRVPTHIFERIRKVSLADATLNADGSIPSIAEVARTCGLSEPEVRDCRRLAVSVASLDEALHPTTGTDALHGGLTAEDVREAVASLPPRDADVLRRRFGLDGDRETLEQVGRHLGVTRERVRQIESVALARLRSSLSADPDEGQLVA